MMGVSHAIMSFALVYGATGKAVPASLASAGALFPDWIERVVYGKKWMKHHRKWSHWFVPYLGLAWWLSRYIEGIPLPSILKKLEGTLYLSLDVPTVELALGFLFFWLVVGCLLHILEDGFFGPIPVLIPWRRHRLVYQLFKTGGMAERIISRLALISAVVLRYVDGTGSVVG
ncbi:LexA-binding, inner membrane-associated putative hydrolase [Dethiosulfovibrio salsuginis]|uniref:LexA-binding, inner membrane-associated putative hydrolase n=2 Tax=Dethiosulfovibrio salsuginis TaxID=561720 RepID=A0A1X7K6K8_9BACT|nr:LexA-binding, inner membrane-associated putative hydrolase [Dethiosulfovibrio salsuginis]